MARPTGVEAVELEELDGKPLLPQAVDAGKWLDEMMPAARRMAPDNRLFTVGNCQSWLLLSSQIYRHPEVRMAMTDSYVYGSWKPADNAMRSIHNSWKRLSGHGKPVMLTEIGYHNNGDAPHEARVGVHRAYWSSSMLPMPATAMYWWWSRVHRDDLAELIRPVAAFWKGEDRRTRSSTHSHAFPRLPTSSTPAGIGEFGTWREAFEAATLPIGDGRLYGYISPVREGRFFIESPPPVRGLTVNTYLSGTGRYAYEFWDTSRGVPIERGMGEGQYFRQECPEFTRDLAFKVWRLAEGESVELLAASTLPEPPPPRTTLRLETRRIGDQEVPENEPEARALVAAERASFGGGPWPLIDVRMNPFGENENFLALYDGQLFCTQDGDYAFAVNSDDASFLWIDDDLVVEWGRAACAREGALRAPQRLGASGHGDLERRTARAAVSPCECQGGVLDPRRVAAPWRGEDPPHSGGSLHSAGGAHRWALNSGCINRPAALVRCAAGGLDGRTRGR